ncbi:MAG: D-alanine--D-alanine ligase family protein [Planctomycetota bacterium]
MSGTSSQAGALRVAVIVGGQSAEREVSLRTGETVARELAGRFAVRKVEILSSGRWVVGPAGEGPPRELDPLEALRELQRTGVDVAFNALHGPFGEDGTIQGLFRAAGLPLTGPDVIPAAVTMDKRLAKLAMAAAGVSTPRFFALSAAEVAGEASPEGGPGWKAAVEAEGARVPHPWIAKPSRLGSSVGCAVFAAPDAFLREAPELVRGWPAEARRGVVLVEEFISGRELSSGVVETKGAPLVLPPVEIRTRTRRFFDYHAKYVPGETEELCPAPLSAAETKLVQETALRVHRLFECAPLSRTDMFLSPSGAIQVLEVNTLPGMTATSLIPLSASAAGMPLATLLAEIVEHALSRCRRDSRDPAGPPPA